jgi:flavin prenyltransferase
MKKIIIAITGASGSIYALHLLKLLKEYKNQIEETAVIFSDDGKKVWDFELDVPVPSGSYTKYRNDDFFAPVASGSSAFDAMIVCPCSMGTLGRIACGTADTLITRCADVMLKERRKLILVTREAPLNLIHIKNMETVTLAGGIIFPASPSFYHKPESIDELIQYSVQRILELAGIKTKMKRWGGKSNKIN